MKSRRTHLNRIATLLFIVSLCSSIAASSAAAKPSMEGGDVFFAAARHPGSNSAPTNTAAPSITGTAVAGSTLTTTPGTWSGQNPSLSYSWSRCGASSCASISGATQTSYLLASADVGFTIKATVTAKNNRGQAAASSLAVGPVSPAPAPPGGGGGGGTVAPPTSTALPTISGTTTQGAQLSSSTGTWNGSPTGYSYQWLRCDSTGGVVQSVHDRRSRDLHPDRARRRGADEGQRHGNERGRLCFCDLCHDGRHRAAAGPSAASAWLPL